jgi:hypothetical protein
MTQKQLQQDAQRLANEILALQRQIVSLLKVAGYVAPLLDLAMTSGKISAFEARWIFLALEEADNWTHMNVYPESLEQAEKSQDESTAIARMYITYKYWNSNKPEQYNETPPVPIHDPKCPQWHQLWYAYSRHVTNEPESI